MSKGQKVVVRRSPWKALGVALAGVPLVLLVLDYAFGIGGFFDAIIDWSYGNKEPEAWEARDDILAALIGVVGAGMVLFGLKELIAPRRVFRADTEGVQIPLSGPFGRRTEIGWPQIEDLSDEGRALLLHLTNAGGVPEDPWGARWEGDRTLRIPTTWWERKPEWVIDQIAARRLPDEARERQAARALEESRAHAAAMEVISGAAVVADPTEDPAEPMVEPAPTEAVPDLEPVAADAPPDEDSGPDSESGDDDSENGAPGSEDYQPSNPEEPAEPDPLAEDEAPEAESGSASSDPRDPG